MRDFKVKPATCYQCGAAFNRSAAKEDIPPCPGDFTLCIKCGALHVFTVTLGAREPTAEELAEAATMPEVLELRAAIKRTQS